MRRIVRNVQLGALAVLSLACDWLPAPAPDKAPVDEAGAKAPASAPKGPGPAPLVKARKAVTQHMPNHFAAAHDVVDAIIDGDLESAQQRARALADHSPKSMPAAWFPYLERMRAAARDVVAAPDLAAAAAATARVTQACGSCHAGQGKGPPVPNVPAPATTPDSCMLGHKWAAERLWLGVAVPSDDAWRAGTQAFAARQACPNALDDGPSDEDVFRTTAQTLAKQSAAAAAATDLEARARLYGELLHTCGTCHRSGC